MMPQPFGSQSNQDAAKDNMQLAMSFEPQEVNRLHDKDDVDNDDFAHHHTLGFDTGQAAPGYEMAQIVKELRARLDALEGP